MVAGLSLPCPWSLWVDLVPRLYRMLLFRMEVEIRMKMEKKLLLMFFLA